MLTIWPRPQKRLVGIREQEEVSLEVKWGRRLSQSGCPQDRPQEKDMGSAHLFGRQFQGAQSGIIKNDAGKGAKPTKGASMRGYLCAPPGSVPPGTSGERHGDTSELPSWWLGRLLFNPLTLSPNSVRAAPGMC